MYVYLKQVWSSIAVTSHRPICSMFILIIYESLITRLGHKSTFDFSTCSFHGGTNNFV